MIARIVVALWGAFALSWIAAARWSAPVAKRIGFGKELGSRVALWIGGIFLFVPAHGYYGPLRFWLVTLDEAWICVGLMVAGFVFSWWARVQLGPLWSGRVTTKTDHRVIDAGPYAIVRHPIYTGILLAVYATMALKGTLYGIVGALLITVGVWMKARLEEGWLRQELGGDAYDAYSRRVPMLVPFALRAH